MDVEHLKLSEVHIRCRKVFDLFKESSILSYSFDTATEGSLSKIMFVNMMPFFMYSPYGHVTGRCMLIQKSDNYCNKRPE
jgi:hypothetical protein